MPTSPRSERPSNALNEVPIWVAVPFPPGTSSTTVPDFVDANVLLTEDLNHGRRIGNLTIINPFLPESSL